MRWQRQQQTVRLWQFTLSTWWDWKHLCVSVRVFPQMPNSGWEGVPWMWAALSQRLAQTMEQNGNKNKPTRRGTICFLAAIKQARLLLLTVHYAAPHELVLSEAAPEEFVILIKSLANNRKSGYQDQEEGLLLMIWPWDSWTFGLVCGGNWRHRLQKP